MEERKRLRGGNTVSVEFVLRRRNGRDLVREVDRVRRIRPGVCSYNLILRFGARKVTTKSEILEIEGGEKYLEL